MNSNQRIGYLQYLCNKYGDFKVAIAGKGKDGQMFWTKHRSVLECWESEQGIWFLSQANNRQILEPEIVLDMDDNPNEQSLNEICDFLENLNVHYKAYFTGSRGFHVHIIDPELALFDKREREAIRAWLIKKTGCDLMKAHEVMIALEDAPHWKTGNPKTLMRSYPCQS